MFNDIIILGDGLLGTEIQRQTAWDYISRKKDGIDFNYLSTYVRKIEPYNQVLNCIGYTDTYSENMKMNMRTNFKAVIDLVNWCNAKNKKIIHISTDYIYSNSNHIASELDPPSNCANWYGYTKLLGDGYVQAMACYYLLIRTSFKPYPFPYAKSIIQFGNFDYVDKIAKFIIKLIKYGAEGIYNVGTEYKTMHELAIKSNSKVVKDYKILHETMPIDISMNIRKMQKFLEAHNE